MIFLSLSFFSRIIDIWYDANRGKMYTVSNDKRFAVSDVNFDSKMIEINKSVHNYTKLLADDENNRLFAATEGGIIELYSLDKYPPEKICRIRIHGAGCISDFCFNKYTKIKCPQIHQFQLSIKGRFLKMKLRN